MPDEDAFTVWYNSAILSSKGADGCDIDLKDVVSEDIARLAFEAGWRANDLAPYEVWERD